MVPAAPPRAGRSDLAGLSLGMRESDEEDRGFATFQPWRRRCVGARQRNLSQRLRDDGHGNADDSHQPLAKRGTDEPGHGAGIHPGAAAHDARRRLAACRAGGEQFALERRGRTAGQEVGQRPRRQRPRPAGHASVLLGRLFAGRLRLSIAIEAGGGSGSDEKIGGVNQPTIQPRNTRNIAKHAKLQCRL